MSASCPSCGSRVRVHEDMLGRKVSCGNCQAVFRLGTAPPPQKASATKPALQKPALQKPALQKPAAVAPAESDPIPIEQAVAQSPSTQPAETKNKPRPAAKPPAVNTANEPVIPAAEAEFKPSHPNSNASARQNSDSRVQPKAQPKTPSPVQPQLEAQPLAPMQLPVHPQSAAQPAVQPTLPIPVSIPEQILVPAPIPVAMEVASPANFSATSATAANDNFAQLESQTSPYEQYAAQMLSRQSGYTNDRLASSGLAGEAATILAPAEETVWDDGVRWGLYLIAIGMSAAILATVSARFQVWAALGAYSPLVGVGLGLLGSLVLTFSMLRHAGQGLLLGGLSLCCFALLGVGLPWLKLSAGWGMPQSSGYLTGTRTNSGMVTRNVPRTDSQSAGFSAPKSSGFGGPRSNSENKSNDSRKELGPEYKWQNHVLTDFPCRVEFPDKVETRWGELKFGDKKVAFKEQFCRLKSGIQLIVGGVRFNSDEERATSNVDRRAALFNQLRVDHQGFQNSRCTVLGEEHPYLEIQGGSGARDRSLRIKFLGDESVLVWAFVSGKQAELSSDVATRFLNSFSSPTLKVASNEAAWLLEASGRLELKSSGTVAGNSAGDESRDSQSPFETPAKKSTSPPGFGNDWPASDFPSPEQIQELQNRALAESELIQDNSRVRSQLNELWGRTPRRPGSDSASQTRVAGLPSRSLWLAMHPDRLPMLGCNFAFSKDRTAIGVFCPVYDSNQPHKLIAENGYAIAGLKVNVRQRRILGFQVIFMKLQGDGFDDSDQYLSEWVGTEPEADDQVVELAGDGRPVFGIAYSEQHFELSSLALLTGNSK